MRPVLVVAVLTALAACRHDPPKDVADPLSGATPPVASPQRPSRADDLAALRENFQRVHFDLDASTLGPAARAALDANAAILQRHPDVRVEVQGHADDRGTVDYNLALGSRRSAAVVGYLTSVGVASRQLASVSYGEEVPLQRGSDERVWAQNRRAEFRVLTGVPGIEGTVSMR